VSFHLQTPLAASNGVTEDPMNLTRTLTLPEIGLIAGTRVALGVGIGLLVAERLSRETRKGAACALLAVGALTTIPLVVGVLTRHDANGAPESA
jgi:hypothetical protein